MSFNFTENSLRPPTTQDIMLLQQIMQQNAQAQQQVQSFPNSTLMLLNPLFGSCLQQPLPFQPLKETAPNHAIPNFWGLALEPEVPNEWTFRNLNNQGLFLSNLPLPNNPNHDQIPNNPLVEHLQTLSSEVPVSSKETSLSVEPENETKETARETRVLNVLLDELLESEKGSADEDVVLAMTVALYGYPSDVNSNKNPSKLLRGLAKNSDLRERLFTNSTTLEMFTSCVKPGLDKSGALNLVHGKVYEVPYYKTTAPKRPKLDR